MWIIAVPAALVAAAYLGVGWGLTVPVSVGVGAVVAGCVAAVVWKKGSRGQGSGAREK
jgi:hypothetical protein